MADTVYFARDLATGHIKIGFSHNLHTRLGLLRRDHPELVLIATIPGDRRVEEGFHALLLASHVVGEWFRADEAVLAVVGRVAWGLFDLSSLPIGTSPLRSASSQRGWATRRANGTPSRPWLARADEAA